MLYIYCVSVCVCVFLGDLKEISCITEVHLPVYNDGFHHISSE